MTTLESEFECVLFIFVSHCNSLAQMCNVELINYSLMFTVYQHQHQHHQYLQHRYHHHQSFSELLSLSLSMQECYI